MGICGTGMASLAGMLKARGDEVVGSDQSVYPPMSDVLKEIGIPVFTPYDAKNLVPSPDQVIIGNAISRGNPEAEAVLAQKIPHLSMPEALKKFFLSEKTSLVVAGTHGKTTTTSLLAWILESAGRDPSFFVGGKPANFPFNFKLGKGRYFVLEGDEYDTAFFDKGPKFLHYQPQHVLLTSIEFDHADIFRDLGDVVQAFQKLLGIIPPQGTLVANLDYPEVARLVSGYGGKVITYAMEDKNRGNADYFGEVLKTEKKMTFCIVSKGKGKKISHHEVTWEFSGRHNVSNALGAVALALDLGLKWKEIHQGLVTFRGVRRRQEVLAEIGGITLIDDFAHHPTSVQETIQGIRDKFPKARLWAIFEPRSNSSKRDIFQKDYSRSFSGADQVILADVFMPEKVKEGKVLDVEAIAKTIDDDPLQGEARHIAGVDSIVHFLEQESRSGDVLLFMSNGGFGGITQKTIKALASKT